MARVGRVHFYPELTWKLVLGAPSHAPLAASSPVAAAGTQSFEVISLLVSLFPRAVDT